MSAVSSSPTTLQRQAGKDQRKIVPTTPGHKEGSEVTSPALSFPCSVEVNSDGSAEAMIHIEPEVMRRIKTRAQSQNLSEYIWYNIIRQALETHVY